MNLFVKKLTMVFLVIGYGHCNAQDTVAYYKLTVHVTHNSDAYAQEKWQQCVNLVSALSEQCNERDSDKSAEAFNQSQQEAITTIRKICMLCDQESSLNIAIDTSSNPLQTPEAGLWISFEYYVAPSTSQENQSQIQVLMNSIREKNTSTSREELLNNLSDLEKIFYLFSGRSELSVQNFEI